MAIYHAHIKSFSRGKGESSIAAAAYRAGLDLDESQTKILHRYSHRKDVVGHFMLAPPGAPKWCDDVRAFWDANEAWESRGNARVARELEVSLPSELDPKQREKLALALGQLLVDRYKVVVLAAIHEPTEKGDERNFHVHLLMSAREIGPTGFGDRAGTEFDARGGRGANEIRLVRELVGNTINAHLSAAKIDARVDHRTLKAQAQDAAAKGDHTLAVKLGRLPTQHFSKAAKARERRGESPDRTRSPLVPDGAAIARAEREGRLMSESTGHTHAAAQRDRVREQAANPPARHAPTPRALSTAALHLSRLVRIAKASGKGAEVLNAEAEVIEGWIKVQNEAAKAALDSLLAIPGLRPEPELTNAFTTLGRRRVDVYGMKLFYFEDTETLTNAITDYAKAMRRPHENRERVQNLRAKISVESGESQGRWNARMAKLRRDHWQAREAISKTAKREDERQINACRTTMTEARNHIEKNYYITVFEHVTPPTPPSLPSETDDGGKKSDSNTRELRPRPPGSLGLR
jgi:hypothetical protein